MSEPTSRKRLQFSLRALIILMTLLAVGAGAYMVGYQSGYRAAKEVQKADYVIWKEPAK